MSGVPQVLLLSSTYQLSRELYASTPAVLCSFHVIRFYCQNGVETLMLDSDDKSFTNSPLGAVVQKRVWLVDVLLPNWEKVRKACERFIISSVRRVFDPFHKRGF